MSEHSSEPTNNSTQSSSESQQQQGHSSSSSGSSSDPKDYYKHTLNFWNDLFYLMTSKSSMVSSSGFLRKMPLQARKITKELIEANDDLIQYTKLLTEYYRQLSTTWADAQRKANEKISKLPNDSEYAEASKRISIDVFENDFTELFNSEEFGKNFGKMISSEMELTKHWTNITNVMLESANMPTKKEIADLYKELHALRRRVSRLEKENSILKENR